MDKKIQTEPKPLKLTKNNPTEIIVFPSPLSSTVVPAQELKSSPKFRQNFFLFQLD